MNVIESCNSVCDEVELEFWFLDILIFCKTSCISYSYNVSTNIVIIQGNIN